MSRFMSSSTHGVSGSYRKETWLISMCPLTFSTVCFSSATSGSAFRIGSAISSTGLIDATESAIPASDEKAPLRFP